MYARSACASSAVSASLIFTRSPIDTSPRSFPSSTTGRWRKRPWVINPSASSTGIASRPSITLQVMRDSTGKASKSRSPSAYMRSTSRSVKMPTGQAPESGTTTEPTCSACMVRIASATLDRADTVITRRPFAASTSFSVIGASLRGLRLPILRLAGFAGAFAAHMSGNDGERGDDGDGQKHPGDSAELLAGEQPEDDEHRMHPDAAAQEIGRE